MPFSFSDELSEIVLADIERRAGLGRIYDALYAADGEDHNAEFEASEAAELEILFHPCRSLDDVRSKAKIAIEDELVRDTLSNTQAGLVGFLRSLLGKSGFPEGGAA